MEEVYTLSDGSQVDISNYSQFEKTSFLIKNPGAKKQKGVAKSANVTSNKPQAQNGELSQANGSSGSQKLRLANEQDLESAQNTGIMPPPSSQPRTAVDDYRTLYDLEQNKAREKDNTFNQKISLPGARSPKKITSKLDGSKEELKKFVDNFSDNPVTGELGEDNKYKIAKTKEKIQNTDSELKHPYLYYSSTNQEQPDDFINKNYIPKELQGLGINPQDFDGFLNKKGFKEDFNKKEAEGLFKEVGRDTWGGYDVGLAKELAKKRMLNMYMEDMQRRDYTKQDLNQDIEIASGARDKKEIQNNILFDQTGIAKYVEKNYPIITQKLKDRDKENAKIYEESKKGGTDFFSWDTGSKMGKAGWNAIVDRTAQMSAAGYGALGMEGTAEGIRMLNEENQFVKADDRGIAYVSGKTVDYNGTKYIVDSKGEIYDADAKIRVTDLFNDSLHKKLVDESQSGPSDWVFSTQGAAVQTSGVMADMLIQAAITHGVGEFGTVASETRTALNGAKQTSKFTSLLNDSSKLLREIPMERATGYSMIAQGTMGYAQGFEDSLKAARDNGINDKDAFEIATAAAQRMGVLYGTTGVISPQTEVAENIFGSKNIIKKAIEQYTKTGKTGVIEYLDNMIKTTPRNLLEFAEHGGAEVVQENSQQVGELGVNMMTNADAHKKIMNETMSGDDFMNTSILSFISAGLMAKVKLPDFHRGSQEIDNLTSLSTLAKNKKEFTKIIDGLVGQKVFNVDQADNLKKDVDIYANNINKLPKSISPDAAMPVMKELDKVSKLLDEKETVDKAFHPKIDEKIESIRENINKIQVEETLKTKNRALIKALEKGVIKDTEFKTFKSTQELESYLVDTFNMKPADAKFNASNKGLFLNSNYLNDVSNGGVEIPTGKKFIFVNEEVAVKRGDFSVGQHEFLHALIHETVKDDPEAKKLLGTALSKELMKMQDLVKSEGKDGVVVPKDFVQKFGNYVRYYEKANDSLLDDIDDEYNKYREGKITKEEYDTKKANIQQEIDSNLGDKWEETLTLYSDAISQGLVKYDEGTMTRLKDTIRQVLQYLGIKDVKFESGKDVYNFLKDYNKSVESGNWGLGMRKLGKSKAEINRESLREEVKAKAPVKKTEEQAVVSKPKFSLAPERKSSEDIKKDVNKGYNKEKWSAGTTEKGENPAVNKVLYDILNEYEYIIKGKAKGLGYSNLPDYSEMDMISETQMELIPHIRNFNKEFFQKREEYKKELENSGLKPDSKEFKDKVEAQDAKGYKGKKGIVKENDDLNAWINSQLVNKMGNALKSGNVTTQKFTEDIDNEMFKETKIIDGHGGEEGYLMDEGNTIFDTQQDFNEEQNRLANLLSDPVYSFVDDNGKPIDIETVPFGGFFVTEATDPSVAANRKLKTETDPAKIAELKSELKDLQRGLELQAKKDITYEEKEELKNLKSFKSYDLSTGMMVNTFKALSIQDIPAKIVTDEVGREILRSPNIETLEYRNFKEKLSTLSKTMARRMTFKNGPEIESLMYREWKLLYDIINHPIDAVTGESSYASKKLPPRLKQFDEKGNLEKIKNITRVKFLQSYYGIEEATRIIKTYGKNNVDKQLREFDDVELSEVTGKNLWATAYFDRRTALMELFGDVMVLQEARRLIRQPEFLDRVAERNVNLYNDLKDDVIRAKVLNDMAKGKSNVVKFSLADNKENKKFLNNFPNLLQSKEYKNFKNKVGDIYHSGSDIEKNWNKYDTKAIWFSAGDSQGWYGDGTLYKSNISDLPGSIVIPDWNRSGSVWNKRFSKEFPEVQDALLRDMYDSDKNTEYMRDEYGNILYNDDLGNFTWKEYLEEEFPRIFNFTGNLDFDEFIKTGESKGKGDLFEKIVKSYLKRNADRKPLIKKVTFEEYKKNQLKFESPTPGIFWLLDPKNIKYADKVILEYIKGFEEDPDSYLEQTEGGGINPDGTLGDYTELIVIGPMQGYKMEKESNKGVFNTIKFSLAETNIKSKLPNLLKSKEYKTFREAIKGNYLGHSGSEVIIQAFKTDKTPVLWWHVDGEPERTLLQDRDEDEYYGDGIYFQAEVKDLDNLIIIPDLDDMVYFEKYFTKKHPITAAKINQKAKEDGEHVAFHIDYILNKSGYADLVFTELMKYTDEGGLKKDYELYQSDDSGVFSRFHKGKIAGGLQVATIGKINKKQIAQVTDENGLADFSKLITEYKTDKNGYLIGENNEPIFKNPNIIKFSLAEEENGRLSNFLEGLPFTEQWVVARDIDKAINNSKVASGTKNTFNVPSMSKSSDKAIAYTIISKVTEGYNDFEFKVKKNANGILTKQVLDALDFKSKEVQDRINLNNNLEQGMNEIIEQNKGIKADETFSPETAKNIGKNINKNEIFLPAEDEDFLGLLYTLASGKGSVGEKQIEFLTDNLLKPYSDAMLNLMKARQTMYKDWNDLINKKHKGISSLLKQDSGYGGYLIDQAVRVYLWKKARYPIPGLDNKDMFHLLQIVRTNPRLRSFAEDVSLLSKQTNGYVEPGHNWGFGSVVGDINNIISKSNRTKFLEHWNANVEKIFSKDNKSKIEALYGRNYVQALNDMLYRMKTGSNRAEGASDALLNWINGSTAVTMFLNIRSALLQTLGAINYINTSDNNFLQAGKALLNVKQYIKDYMTIWNSDYLQDRRSGLMNDVAEAELAQLMNDARNINIADKVKAANYWLLKQGFGPTRVMDSFAIAIGGAGFYRNRLNTYLKEGMNQDEAEKATMRDFYDISEISQQSGDVSKISKNQASTKGRLLLSFMNTPFQYSRIIKKSTIDLVKGRGSAANNIAKILYYSTIQNLLFNFMQNALFSMIWDDDEEKKKSKFWNTAKVRTINGAFDTLIRGTGLKGVILATVKNTAIKWYEKHGDPKGYGDVLLEMANISPSIGIKARALTKSYKSIEYNTKKIKRKGFSIHNTPAIEALTSLTSATTNVPLDRLYQKVQNVSNALDSDYKTWQRIAFALGYSEWNLGLGKSGRVKIKDNGEFTMPEFSQEEFKQEGF